MYPQPSAPLPAVVEPEPQRPAAPLQEEGLRARRSSLTSSFRAGLRSLRSSLRRQLGGSPPPPQPPPPAQQHEPAAIPEDGETTVTAEEAVRAAVAAALEMRAEAAKAAPPGGEAANQAAKPASLDEPAEEGGRRNFTAVSIDQCEDEKERTRL